jgi:hypothetical protein
MVSKKFDKELYAENDRIAREKAKSYFSRLNFQISDNPDQYGPDLILTDGTQTCFVECEIKHNWSGDVFPFETIQFPERKAKFARMGVVFFMLNHQLTRAIVVPGNIVLSSPVTEVPNKYVTSGENFFQVPLIKAVIVKTE